jgi:class 3 adenylate cyclase
VGDVPPQSTAIGFVPRLLVDQLSAAPGAALAPRAERVDAAVLFADISGFTPLTESFAARGPAGAEVLQRLLNEFFSDLIDVVAAHGGDVSTLAGDAVIAFWTATKQRPLAAAVHDSLSCATAMHAALLSSAAAGRVSLRLRIGVGAGSLWTATVGGVDERWEYLVAGGALVEAGAALAQAQPGQTIVANSAWHQTGSFCEGTRGTGEFVRLWRIAARGNLDLRGPLRTVDVADRLLRLFVPKVVRAESGSTARFAEFRLVTIVFLIADLNYEVDGALQQSQSAFTAVQEIVSRYQGSLNRFAVDDKGTVGIAAWGVRASAHEEDAAQALDAALAINRAFEGQGIAGPIGVTTTRVFCSVVGNSVRMEFMMMGGGVNVAARLAQTGTGVLCDAATVRAAGPRHRFESQGPLRLKGVSAPVPVFRPLGSTPSTAGSPAVLVGRAGEWGRVRDHVHRIARGARGAVVVLEGEAGIGKSFLLRHAAADAESRGLNVARGSAEVAERATPHFVWRAVLLDLFDARTLAAPELARRVLGRLDPAVRQWAPLLNSVLPMNLADSPATRQLTGQGRANLMRDLIVQLLEASAGPGLLVTLDDGHWFDVGTWGDIAAVSRTRAPLIVLVATRPADTRESSGYGALLDADGVDRVLIDRLTDQDLLALVREWTSARQLSTDVETFFRERARGNPFYAEELLRTLQDQHALMRSGDTCRFAATADRQVLDALPHRVQGVVAARIDRLGLAQQTTLKAASVVTGSFSRRLLAAIHPMATGEDRLAADLEELAHRGLIVSEGDHPGGPTFAFKHVITREVAYDQLSFDDRRTLNRQVARWHEREHAVNLDPYIPLLAHHWKEAASPHLARSAQAVAVPSVAQQEDGRQAIAYLDKAAEQALAVYANTAAIRSLESIIELDELLLLNSDRLTRARWQWRLGHANLQRSNNRASERHLEQSLALLGRPTPRHSMRWLGRLLGRTLALATSRLTARLRRIERTERLSIEQAADVYHELSEIAYFDNSLPRLLYTMVQTLDLADRSGSPRLIARASATAAVATGTARLHRIARYYCKRSLAAATRTEDLPARAFSQLACGVYLSGVGAWQHLDGLLEDSARTFAALGDRYRYELTIAQRAYMFLHRGQFTRAREMLEESLTRTDALQVRLLGTAGLVVADLAQNRLDSARLDELEAILGDIPQRSERILGTGVLAAARLRAGDAAAARKHAAAVRPFAFTVPPAFYALRGVAGLCETQVRMLESPADAGRAARSPRDAMSDLRRFSFFFPIGLPSAHLWAGRCLLHENRYRRAERAFTLSTRHAERLGMPYDAALAYLERGQAPHVPPAERREHLERAAGILASLHAEGDLSRAEHAMLAV